MASNDTQLKGMEEIITCSLCLELYTDARTLTCLHCFCLTCLNNYQTSVVVKPCPLCRADTVPAVSELHRLPPNRAVNDMVGLVMKHRGEAGGQTTSNQHRGPPVNSQKPSIPPPPYTPSEPNKPKMNQPTARASTRSTTPPQPTAVPRPQRSPSPDAGEMLAALFGLRTRKTEHERRVEAVAETAIEALAEAFTGVRLSGNRVSSGNPHRGVQCDECGTLNIQGIRYKCGICADYDLCEKCERKPRMLVHDMKHIFVKLRRPATRRVGQGQILHPVGFAIGQQMHFDRDIQTSVVSADLGGLTLQAEVPITCDRCGEEPIRGIRFKCGMCDDYDLCADCEKDSPSFHPRDHVFLVIPHPSKATQGKGRLLRVNFY